MPVVNIPGVGPVQLVDREQLRFKMHGRRFSLPRHLEALMASMPPAPPSFDGSKARAIQYPILGNDQEGDCYLVDALHCIQTWLGNVSVPPQFDTSAVLKLYHQLSGGDNGLGDDQIFPAWKKGIFGHKILDEMTVKTSDVESVRFGLWKFFGGSYTASLLTGWLSNAGPGVVWDAGMGHADRNAGHAMHLSGFVAKGAPLPFKVKSLVGGTPSPADYYFDETWGFGTPIMLTTAGVAASDPEITLQFSIEMFDPATGLAPDGESYEQKAAWWVACGGNRLPVSPFPPAPAPVPPVDWGPPVDWN